MSTDTKSDAKPVVYLVTGGNDGVGFEVVKQLAETGALVFLGSRLIDNAHAAIQKFDENIRARVTPVQLDITSIESVNAAVETVKAAGGLDVLVNNAAIFGGDGLTQASEQSPATLNLNLVRTVFETNYFGTVQVTNGFLPLLQVSTRPAVVFVSQAGASNTVMSSAIGNPESFLKTMQWVGYTGSKTALNSYVVSLAIVFPKIRINAVTPGFTATKLNGYGSGLPGAKTIPQGAAAIVKVAVVGPEGPTGKFYNDDGSELPW